MKQSFICKLLYSELKQGSLSKVIAFRFFSGGRQRGNEPRSEPNNAKNLFENNENVNFEKTIRATTFAIILYSWPTARDTRRTVHYGLIPPFRPYFELRFLNLQWTDWDDIYRDWKPTSWTFIKMPSLNPFDIKVRKKWPKIKISPKIVLEIQLFCSAVCATSPSPPLPHLNSHGVNYSAIVDIWSLKLFIISIQDTK